MQNYTRFDWARRNKQEPNENGIFWSARNRNMKFRLLRVLSLHFRHVFKTQWSVIKKWSLLTVFQDLNFWSQKQSKISNSSFVSNFPTHFFVFFSSSEMANNVKLPDALHQNNDKDEKVFLHFSSKCFEVKQKKRETGKKDYRFPLPSSPSSSHAKKCCLRTEKKCRACRMAVIVEYFKDFFRRWRLDSNIDARW